jgi:hypothetical protein
MSRIIRWILFLGLIGALVLVFIHFRSSGVRQQMREASQSNDATIRALSEKARDGGTKQKSAPDTDLLTDDDRKGLDHLIDVKNNKQNKQGTKRP